MANKQFINGFDADIIPNFQITSAIPLSGGLTNRCWKLTGYYQGRLLTAVWRPVSAISQAFFSRSSAGVFDSSAAKRISCSITYLL